VFYAVTNEGIELPVIDVTHSSFSVEDTEARMREAWEQEHREQRRWEGKPAWQRRLMFWLARRNSVLLQSLWKSEGTFLNAMATYLMKLGPAHLGAGYTKPLDRRIAASANILDVRLRLQRVAHLIADALEPALLARPVGAVHLVDIAGGPAIDAINALIIVRRRSPALLDGRTIRLHVLDAHRDAPDFGARALAALQSQDGPLHGLNCRFEFRQYDWNDCQKLRETLAELEPDAVAAGSSEGGLFQYGSDEAIVNNLTVLRAATPADFTVTGTISPPSPENLHARRMVRIPLRHFTTAEFEALAVRAGWHIDRLLEARRTYCVRLVKGDLAAR
jgi:hypothetical protein